MDIGNVKGNGGIDRASDRATRADGKRAPAPKRPVHDEAAISQSGRDTAKTVDALAQRAQQDDAERAMKVEAARQKLQAGALDADDVHREVARQLLAGDFQTLA